VAVDRGFIKRNHRRHPDRRDFESLGRDYVPMLERLTILVVLWLILMPMYRRASPSKSYPRGGASLIDRLPALTSLRSPLQLM
jgi:hypothetical protein